jgi:peroxiredoxin
VTRLALLFALTACNADPDSDGLTNAQERELGTGIKIRDTDDDGLGDGDEVEAGTDPLRPDTDGDGASDGEEVDVGTDALDPWSYPADRWPDLSGLAPAEGTRGWADGQRAPAFDAIDQRGDTLALDQLWGHVVILQLVAGEYCSACTEVAEDAEGRWQTAQGKGVFPLQLLVDDDTRDGEVELPFASTWAERNRLTLPVLVDPQKSVPVGLANAERYDGRIPLTVVLDREHIVQGVWWGDEGLEALDERLPALIATDFP